MTTPETHFLDALVAGDERAWAQLVARFDGPLRRVARSYRLNATSVDDAVQMTWVRVFTRVGTLRDPEALGAWLTTTVRRECLRLLQFQVREELTSEPELVGGVADPPEVDCLLREQRETVGRALHTLPDRQRRLMLLLADDEDPNYQEISRRLDMPVGSIGPIRARGIKRLRADPGVQALAG